MKGKLLKPVFVVVIVSINSGTRSLL